MIGGGDQTGARLDISAFKRKGITGSVEVPIRTGFLGSESDGPLVISPVVPGIDLVSWSKNNRALLESFLYKHGGVLFRDFGVDKPERFENVAKALSDETLEYRERSSPRRQIHGNVYTSTDYPARESIFMHNENSYQRIWPMKIFFFCLSPAEEGGETPIADTRKVLRLLAPEVVERFNEKKCLYVRNYGGGLGLSWRTVFQTTEKSEVESYCRQSGIAIEWKTGDRLTTRAVRPAISTHPETGERVWFNHAAFFHVTTLDRALSASLRSVMDEEDLPSNTYYGDGSEIEPWVIDDIRRSYSEATSSFAWKKGDILALDNMLMAHSRAPYRGTRMILTVMSDQFTPPQGSS